MDPNRSFRDRAPIVAGGRVTVDPSEFETIRQAVEGGEEWYVAALVHSDGRIAFVQNRWSDGWVLPGGGIEDGESMAAAIEREVREETGLTVEAHDPLAAIEQRFEPTDCEAVADDTPDASTTANMAVFEVQTSNATFGDALGEDPTEIDAAAWFDALPERIDGLSRDLLGVLVAESSIEWPRTVAGR